MVELFQTIKKQDPHRKGTQKGTKTACVLGSANTSLHRLQWAIRILEMVILETGKRMVHNGCSNTENMQPGPMVPGVDEYQGNHSNAGNLRTNGSWKVHTIKLYQKF